MVDYVKSKIIIYTCIRNIGKWAKQAPQKANHSLIDGFFHLIKDNFPETHLQVNSAVTFCDAPATNNGPQLSPFEMNELALNDVLKACRVIYDEFNILKEHIGASFGLDCNELSLGIAVSKGHDLVKIDGIYVDERINLAKYLCSYAKPSGMIIHYDSFKTGLEKTKEWKFKTKTLLAGNRSQIKLWVSKEVKIANKHNYQVHVSGLCFNENNQVLLAMRKDDSPVYPGRWAGPGGRLRNESDFTETLKEKFREEIGIDIKNIRILDTYHNKKSRIHGLMFYCEYDAGELRCRESMKFHPADEVLKMSKVIPDIKDTIKQIVEVENG